MIAPMQRLQEEKNAVLGFFGKCAALIKMVDNNRMLGKAFMKFHISSWLGVLAGQSFSQAPTVNSCSKSR